MKREALADKILCLGVDGLDPRLTRKYVDMGIMPNVKQYIERGAQRHDLVMLGGHPTVTPPMWTTLATGANSNVHGITGFFRLAEDLDRTAYNLDSRFCKAEQVWNCFAEAGKKTLVWHWPGSSWPPSSDSENLMVVDGTSPGSVGMSVAQVEFEYLVAASEEISEVTYKERAAMGASAACIITDLDLEQQSGFSMKVGQNGNNAGKSKQNIIFDNSKQTTVMTEQALDVARSPIKLAAGWAAAPEDAKEFTILMSGGLIRRPSLILKNEDGIYDRVAVYKNKKQTEPIAVLPVGKLVRGVLDESIKGDTTYQVNRNLKVLKLDPEGKNLVMHVSGAMDIHNDSVWHPKRIFKDVCENVGYPTPTSNVGCQDSMLITDCMLDNWYATADWQADALHYLIENENLDAVFSHFHAVDLQSHMFIKHMADRPFNRQPVEVADKWMQDVYKQTDYYLGKFLHYLDEGWTILIFSDHAQVASKHAIPLVFDMNGTVTPVMEELGFTKTYIDEKGNVQIDWTQTKAVMQREGHLYLNLKGRNKHTLPDGTVIDGIVDPADQYEVEEEIMTALYGYKDKETGHRVVSLALRNRDAILLGQGGPEAGDIMVWHAEGYNYDHADCISTTWGESDTSVSPIFIAAGKGLKEGFETDRVIRQVDFAATVALLGGVRMPAQCEGAPVYQILAEEF